MLALTRPDLVARLIVADIAPVAYVHDNLQHIAAMRGLDLSPPIPRAEADRRLSASVADSGLRAFFLQSLDLKSVPPRWRLNLNVLAEFMPQITGWPDPPGQFDGRTLFLTGADSRYVLPAHRDAIKRQFSHARFARLPGAGHWLHADKPREFTETAEVFLQSPHTGP
jgi:esterase